MSYVWRKLPLNIKLVGCLVLVQASTLTLGVIWMGRWVETTRLRELTRRLDSQGDTLEGFVSHKDGALSFNSDNETVSELADDRNFYFRLRDLSGRVVGESTRLGPDTKKRLDEQFGPSNLKESFQEVVLPTGKWITYSEALSSHDEPPVVIGRVDIAANAQPTIDETAEFRRYLSLSALAILITTSLGTGIVVSFSTRNLREFAHLIRKAAPPRFEGAVDLKPQSAEEGLLFDSYKDLLHAARASSESQRLFIAHASHELKTPIAAAMAALEVTLGRKRDAAVYEQTCADVLGEIKTLHRLSTTLLNLARMDATDTNGEVVTTDLSSAVAAIRLRWQKIASTRKISIATHSDFCDPFAPPLVSGSLEQWEIVLSNLTDNAIKYGRDGGEILISTHLTDEDRIVISVKDDGVGMTAAQVERLGEVFYRADTARSSNASFGLGFAYAKRIVEGLRGEIRVVSSLGRGTTVSVVVPRADQAANRSS